MKAVLKAVRQQMQALGINFFIGRKKSKVQYPYFVGQLYDLGVDAEDGMELYELLLNGFAREDDMELIEAAERIRKGFPAVSGHLTFVDHDLIVVHYHSLIPEIPAEDGLYRNQIILKIKKWKGKVIE